MKKGFKEIFKIIIYISFIISVVSNIIINRNNIFNNNTRILKEMNESTQITELNKNIEQLNVSHTEYAEYIQECKQSLINAITEQGVDTSIQASIDEVVDNIGNILKVRTKNATATADNITEGKTAWVNGELITGTGVDNNDYYNQGLEEGGQTANFTINITVRAVVQSNSNNFVPSGGSKTVTASYRYENGNINFSAISQSSNFNPDSVSNANSFRVSTCIDSVEIIFD